MGYRKTGPRVFIVGIRKDMGWKSGDGIADGLLPYPTNNYPSIEELFSDLVDPYYEKSYETIKYPRNPESEWQEELRRTEGLKEIKRKGDPVYGNKYTVGIKIT